jgi:hypothetical protein
MNNGRPRIVAGGAMAALALAALWGVDGDRTAALAADGDKVEYTFGRPVKDGEQTYDWDRKTHADEAARRYGVDPAKVGDGMDTWHWWCGVDNPQFWRKMAILSAKGSGATNVHQVPLQGARQDHERDGRRQGEGEMTDPRFERQP